MWRPLGVGRPPKASAADGAAADQWPDQRRCLGQAVALDALQRQRRGFDRCDGVAVAVAAVADEAPGLFEAVLPAGQAWILGANVLDEEQLAARFEDSRGLRERGRRVGDRAEDQREDSGVEARVLEWQAFGRRFDQLGRSARVRKPLAQAPR